MTQLIKSTVVKDEDRIKFLPDHCGNHFIQFENLLYNSMQKVCPEYSGGYWEFIELDNGGWYCRLRVAENAPKVKVENSAAYFEGEASADAASIIATLYALSLLSFSIHGRGMNPDKISEAFHLLRDYAAEHDEARVIFQAID